MEIWDITMIADLSEIAESAKIMDIRGISEVAKITGNMVATEQ